MASTLKKGPLQVSIIETYTLNGREHSVKNSSVHDDIRETSSRIVSCPGKVLPGDAATVTSVSDTDATAGLGTYISADIRYIRITNLDDANTVAIVITGDIDTVAAGIPLESGGSFSLTLNLAGSTSFDISNDNVGTAVDIEVFVASV